MLAPDEKLDDWFLKANGAVPSSSREYQTRYTTVITFLTNRVYPYIASSARIVDEGGFLTDHGADHVATVIERASSMLRNDKASITWYEAYLLLMSIAFHDVGNIFGREKHETKAVEIMKEFTFLLGPDSIEKRQIRSIAEAHGGANGNDKDKIGKLYRDETILNQIVRPRFLAAVLRFADELADERSRAARYMLDHGLVPGSSEIYHRYAEALHSVRILGNTIELFFELPISSALRTFQKGAGDSYLLDEMHLRIRKMHFERLYCMRFLRPFISLDRLSVDIRIFADEWGEVVRHFAFVLQEDGYPDTDREVHFRGNGIPTHATATFPSGESLAQELRKNKEEASHEAQ